MESGEGTVYEVECNSSKHNYIQKASGALPTPGIIENEITIIKHNAIRNKSLFLSPQKRLRFDRS
jgi:hypothetical protein